MDEVVVLDVLPDGFRLIRNRGGHRIGSALRPDGLHRGAGHLLLLPGDRGEIPGVRNVGKSVEGALLIATC